MNGNVIITSLGAALAVLATVNAIGAVQYSSTVAADDAKARKIYASSCVQLNHPLALGQSVDDTKTKQPIGPGVPVCDKLGKGAYTNAQSQIDTIYPITDWNAYLKEKAARIGDIHPAGEAPGRPYDKQINPEESKP
jgi:hypothetical protein